MRWTRRPPFGRSRPKTDPPAHLAAGRQAEDLAAHYLQGRGLTLLARNYRCRPGELDLVMRTADELVAVEVRYRRHSDRVSPFQSVTAAKRRRLLRAAQHYAQAHPQYADWPWRFDVLSLSGPRQRVRLEWLPAAFDSDDCPEP